MDGINTVIQFSQWVMGLLTAQKTASAAADSAAATATTAEGAAEAASIPAKTAATVANKALESSVLDLAAAQIFAAHAAIPFADARNSKRYDKRNDGSNDRTTCSVRSITNICRRWYC